MSGSIARCAVVVLALTAAIAAAPSAPDLILATEQGSSIRLSEFKGKVVLVDFWASWCLPCRASFPALDKLQKELGSKGVEVLAVNVDEERRKADDFLAKRSHSLAVVFDPQGTAAAAFRLSGMPSTVILDRQGEIRFRHVGYTEKTIDKFRAEILLLLGES